MVARRSRALTLLLRVLVAVFACVGTASPTAAAVHASAAPSVFAAGARHANAAVRPRTVARRIAAHASAARAGGPPAPLSTCALPATLRIVVARAGEERTRIDAKALERLPRASISRPLARGPPTS